MKAVRLSSEMGCDFERHSILMDQEIWSQLPGQLVDRVLGFLPLTSGLRFRCVCRHWKSTLSSGRFVEHASSSAPMLLCLTTFPRGSRKPVPVVHAFNPESCNWGELSLSFLYTAMSEFFVIAAQGSLLYLQGMTTCNDDEEVVYVTCNPLTKSWRQLPPKIYDEEEEQMIPDVAAFSFCLDSEFSYKVIELTEATDGTTCIQTYDSCVGRWSRVDFPGPFSCRSRIIRNQCLYGVTRRPLRLTKKKLGDSVTECPEVSLRLPASALNYYLVECCSHIVLVATSDGEAYVSNSSISRTPCLRAWKLNESSMDWSQVTTMPKVMFANVVKGGLAELRCSGQRFKISFTNESGKCAYVYDMIEDSWAALPKCPPLADGQSWMEEMFFFTPSFRQIP